MGNEIKTSQAAVGIARAELIAQLDDFCGFRLRPISVALPVAGSDEHDGRIGLLLGTALASFHEAVECDASALQDVHESLVAADLKTSARLGGRS